MRFPPMKTNLDEMLAFVSVVDSGSITAAAEELGLPALSRQTTPLGDRVLIDARSASTDPIFRIAQANGLRVNEVSLERAVLALEERA